jgi:hypothetical protein
MKKIYILTTLLFFTAIIIFFKPLIFATDNESSAVNKVASEILDKKDKLKDKKIGIFYFTNLDGKETAEGKRLSQKLLEQLIKKDKLTFVERSEIAKLLKAHEIEQLGVVDADSLKEEGKVLPIDVMIAGTITILGPKVGELSVKGVNIVTGEIYFMINSQFEPESNFSYQEDQNLLNLNKKSPEQARIVQNTYNGLLTMSVNRPFIFILVVLNDNELSLLQDKRPKLYNFLQKRKRDIKDNSNLIQRMTKLKNGLVILRTNSPDQYNVIMKRKNEILNRRRQ